MIRAGAVSTDKERRIRARRQTSQITLKALAESKTESEKELRKVWVKQLEKEIEGEQRFLSNEILSDALSDDELLSALGV